MFHTRFHTTFHTTWFNKLWCNSMGRFGLLAGLTMLCLNAWAQQNSNAVDPDVAQAKEWIELQKNLDQITEDTWKKMLTPEQYHILWEEGTERAYSGDLLDNKREGVYLTAGCKIPVFSSKHKYESGTGWPSFWRPLDKDNIVLKDDYTWFGRKRIEVESACGEHLGHVFEDGPEPTGLRYCLNSDAFVFVPAEQWDGALE